MTRMKLFACSLLVIVAAGLIAYPVLAHCGKCAADGKKIAAQLDQNKMTLAKAVTAAEQHSKGRAISVISQISEHDQMALHVWCISGDALNAPKILKCYVDLASGKVAGMKEVHEFPTLHDEHDPHALRDHAPDAARDHAPHASAPATTITDQTVEAACGACIYKMPGVTGCPLAVKIDGKAYVVKALNGPITTIAIAIARRS